MTEAEAFSEFHNQLKLDPDEVEFARGFPDEVRQALEEGGVVTTHSFLQGSLARSTMVSPLKDVDMVVSLERGEHGPLLDTPTGPDRSMDLLQLTLEKWLRPRYRGLRFGPRKAHALPIELGNGLPSFDLVPAFETTTSDDDVLIADRDNGVWERSNTRQMIRAVAAANKVSGGTLIHVARMAKHAVRLKLHPAFPGLLVESFALEAIDEPMPYAEGCAEIFETGARMLGSPVADPTGRDDLAPKLEEIQPGFAETAREWFAQRQDEAERARGHAESGDHSQAIAWWHRVFGPPFPLPSDTSTRSAAAALSFGTGAPRPSRAWRRSG